MKIRVFSVPFLKLRLTSSRFTNNQQSNAQASIGNGSQVVFVTGIERRISNKFVAFADLLWPTETSGVTGSAYSPVGRVGAGFKF